MSEKYHTTTFKGINAIVLENDKLKATWLPQYGGKLASLIYKNEHELLSQSKLNELKIPHYSATFSDFDTSGFDECFPSIDLCSVSIKVDGQPKTVNIPDHGEVWAMEWHYKLMGNNRICFSVHSPELGYTLKKIAILTDNQLMFNYQLILDSHVQSLPFLWTPHALFSYNEHTQLLVPKRFKEIINVCDDQHLNAYGDIHEFPTTTKSKIGSINVSKFDKRVEGMCEKYYFLEKLQKNDTFGFQDDAYRVLMNVDEKIVPYLGVWKNQGGYKNQHNFALEPCSGIYDSAHSAQENKTIAYATDKDITKWYLSFTVTDPRTE